MEPRDCLRGGERRLSGSSRVVHRGGLTMTRGNSSTAPSRDKDEQVPMEPIVLLSKKEEIPAATVTTTEGQGKGTIRGTSVERIEESSMLSMSLERDLRRICEENALLAATGNGYEAREKNLVNRMGEEKLNRMMLQREPKRQKQEM